MAGEPSATGPKLVRLMAAVIGSAMAVLFVVLYSNVSCRLLVHESEGDKLILLTQFLLTAMKWFYLVPPVALVMGLLLISRRPQGTALYEALLAVVWLLSLGLVGLCLLSWQAQTNRLY